MITLEFEGKQYNPDDSSFETDVVRSIGASIQLTERELDSLAQLVVRGIGENVTHGTDIYGNALLPLMPATIQRKGSSKPLIDTGSMIRDITIEGTQGIREITANSEYGIYHMTGTKNMVARPWFDFSPYVMNLINQYVETLGYRTAA